MHAPSSRQDCKSFPIVVSIYNHWPVEERLMFCPKATLIFRPFPFSPYAKSRNKSNTMVSAPRDTFTPFVFKPKPKAATEATILRNIITVLPEAVSALYRPSTILTDTRKCCGCNTTFPPSRLIRQMRRYRRTWIQICRRLLMRRVIVRQCSHSFGR